MKKKFKKINGSFLKKAESVLGFSKDILSLIPNKEDNKIAIIVKLLCICGKLLPKSDMDKSYTDAGFIRDVNTQFVSFFTGLNLQNLFEKEVADIDEDIFDIILYNKEIGTLALLPAIDNNREVVYSNIYFKSPDFDFKKLFDKAWEMCNGNIEVNAIKTPNAWYYKFNYNQFFPIIGDSFGSSEKKYISFNQSHSNISSKNTSRSYLFIGPPGTGKSTMAQRFAVNNFKKILKVAASTLYQIQPAEFLSLLRFLNPECIFVDEIDKQSFLFDNFQTGGNILSLLENIKEENSNITMLFTANKVDTLPEPMMRPGRIDDIIEFDLPEEEDRKNILLGYLGDKKCSVLESIIKESEGLSPAHLKEIALRIKSGEDKDIEILIKRMVKYIKIKNDQKK